MIPPPIWRPANAEYHRTRTHWSSSMLKVFRHSPALAFRRFVAGEAAEWEPPTKSQVLGSIANTLLLQQERRVRDIHVFPAKDRKGGAFKAAVKARADQLVVTQSEWEEGEAIANAILQPKTESARVAHRLLVGEPQDGFTEYAHRWEDRSGVPCKAMVDRLLNLHGSPTLVELKSTLDPSPEGFRDQFGRLGYDCQAAFNLRGLQVALGGVIPQFLVVAVRNEEPYEVAVHPLHQDFLELGRRQVEKDLSGIAACLSGARPWCAEWELLADGTLPPLMPPAWRRRDLEPTEETLFS